MECEKCQDRGFTEENHGLVMVMCDCEAAKAKHLEIMGSPMDTARKIIKAREPVKGEYCCTKCNQPHRESSKKGIKHLAYKRP